MRKTRVSTTRKQQTEKELAAHLQAHRDESTEWETLEAEKTPQRGVLTSFRLQMTEFAALQRAAKERGETLSEFVRGAIALRLHGKVVPVALGISSGAQKATQQATFLAPVLSAGQTENSTPSVPDSLFLVANLV